MDRPVRTQLAVAVLATTAAAGLASCAPMLSGGPQAPSPSSTATSVLTVPPVPSATSVPVPGGVPPTTVPTSPPVTLPTVPVADLTTVPAPTQTPPPAVTTPPATTTPPAPDPGTGGETAEVVRLVNVERAKVGCAPLTVHPALTAAAQSHSEDMAANGYFDHESPSGTTPSQRAQAAGYPSAYVSENIAAGTVIATAAQVMPMWMNSDGHRRNILECNTTQIGVGHAVGGPYGHYWTQNFGNPG